MSGIHDVLHGSLVASGPYLSSVVLISIAASAAALFGVRTRRFSARSAHMVLSLALLAPAVAAILAASGAARLVRGLVLPAGAGSGIADPASFGLVYTVGAEKPGFDWICTLFAAWAGVAVLLAFRSIRQSIRWGRVAKRAESITDRELLSAFVDASPGMERLPRFATSAEVAEPMVVGVLAPTVLLPRSYVRPATRLGAAELRAVLAHELEHVRRRDNLTAALHELATAAFWFDPLRWSARRLMLELRERACDQRVLDLGCRSDSYVSALARSCHATLESPAVACMSGFHVKERIESIMCYESERPHYASDKLVRAAAIAGAMILVAAFGAVAPTPTFAGPTSSDYVLNVSLEPVSQNRVHVSVRVTTPAGKALSAEAIFAEAKPASIETKDGTRTLKIDVPNAAAGQTATLEVLEGNAVVGRASAVIQKAEKRALPPPPAGYRRVKGDVKAPVVVTRVQPKYPEEARAERVQGLVIVDAAIDEHGAVKSVRILQDLSHGLGQAAVDAVSQWKFQPATLDGKPVPVAFTLTINFKLDGHKPKE